MTIPSVSLHVTVEPYRRLSHGSPMRRPRRAEREDAAPALLA
jgi:hypothetical protein